MTIHPVGGKLFDSSLELNNQTRVTSYDTVAVDCEISKSEYDNLMNRLIADGYQDTILNGYKLKIYNYNLEMVGKYYYQDKFCHELCIMGYCKILCVSRKSFID